MQNNKHSFSSILSGLIIFIASSAFLANTKTAFVPSAIVAALVYIAIHKFSSGVQKN